MVKNEVFICKQENTGKEKRQLLEVQDPLHCSGKELISDGCPDLTLRVQFLDAVSVLQIEVCQRDASQTAADALCPRGKTD